ncbi:HIT family protein [Paenibacillus lignilyticus]|uniref:HIT family protein n=1 Tax=Paenibacillus lignilyticus TaxID=1172615 RepID=A0ABS5CIB4_9BACL|nr:HIT family protein [Paenibacillus lignilyticus]
MSKYVQDCFICRKHRGDVRSVGSTIYEDGHVHVGHIGFRGEEQTAYLGYVMVELKRHTPGLGDLSVQEAAAVGVIVNEVSRALKDVLRAEHIYSFVQGDGVPHFHMHLIPRYAGTPDHYRNPTNLINWPDAPNGGEAEVEKICSKLRAYLQAI